MSTPDYFHLRPDVEKAYGYAHAVRVGDDIKVSGAVSMDDEGNPTAVGDLAQQMRNVYEDLRRVLEHYGCTFDDVVVENVFTTDMAGFLDAAAYRGTIYTTAVPDRELARGEGARPARAPDRDRARGAHVETVTPPTPPRWRRPPAGRPDVPTPPEP